MVISEIPNCAMDDSDIVVLETSEEEPRGRQKAQSGFTVAPPDLCRKWTQSPSFQSPQRRRVPPPVAYPQPIITNVTSLSPLKGYHSNSSYHSARPQRMGNQNFLHRTQYSPSMNPSVLNVFPPSTEFQQSPIKISEVKSLSPLKNRAVKNGYRSNVVAARRFIKQMAQTQGIPKKINVKKNPECITLSDESDDEVIISSEAVKQETLNVVQLDDTAELIEETDSEPRTVKQEEINAVQLDDFKALNEETESRSETVKQETSDVVQLDDTAEIYEETESKSASNDACDDYSNSDEGAPKAIESECAPSATISQGRTDRDDARDDYSNCDGGAPKAIESECAPSATTSEGRTDRDPSPLQGRDACSNGINPLKRRIKPHSVRNVTPSATLDNFVKACLAVDDSDDMKKILDKKVKKHFLNCDKSFIESRPFLNRLQGLIDKVEKDKSNVYVHIADLTSELKARKSSANHEADEEPPAKKKKEGREPANIDYDALEVKRNEMKIKKLNKTLTKLRKMIKHLETKEVDWENDDEDSTYIMLQRYKDRAVKVFNKLCELTKESKSAGKITKIHFSGTSYPRVNKCVERYVNDTGHFPDYRDILDVIQKAKEEDEEMRKLTDFEMEEIAKNAFKVVGEELQRQRKHGHAESLLALIEGGEDPADSNPELNEQLSKNKEHWQNINKVIDEFAAKEKEKKDSNGSDEKESEDTDEDEEDDSESTTEENDDLANLSAPDDDDDEEEEDEEEEEYGELETLNEEIEGGLNQEVKAAASDEESTPSTSSDNGTDDDKSKGFDEVCQTIEEVASKLSDD